MPPSQRYVPAQVQAAPPSVHISPNEVSRLRGSQGLRRSLSDQSLSQWGNQPQTVAQTSYQEPAGREPTVPSILAGARAAVTKDMPQVSNGFSAARSASKSTVERFASQVDQMRTDGPQVSPIVAPKLRMPELPTQKPIQPPAALPKVSGFKVPTPKFTQPVATQQPVAKPTNDFAVKPAVATQETMTPEFKTCLLYTSDAADE